MSAILILPVVSTLDSPAIAGRFVEIYRIPAPPPTPPAPSAQPPKPLRPDVNQLAAPAEAPTAFKPEEGPPASSGSGLPGFGSFVVGSQPPGAFPSERPATLTAPPVPPAPVRPGGDIRAPQRLLYAPPVYPAIAQTARVEGTVILEAIIDESGVVRDVKVLRSIPLLDRAAMEAVGKWRYTPTRLNGVAVPIIIMVTVTFTLR